MGRQQHHGGAVIFKVNVGYTRAGREKNVYYPTLEAAMRAVDEVCRRTGIVLSIIEVSKPKHTTLARQGNKED